MKARRSCPADGTELHSAIVSPCAPDTCLPIGTGCGHDRLVQAIPSATVARSASTAWASTTTLRLNANRPFMTPAECGEVLGAASRPPPAARQLRGPPSWQGGSAIAQPVPGSGGDGRFAVLARATRTRGAGRHGVRPGLTTTLLQRLAHTHQLQVTVVLLRDVKLLR
jgi:hypothetical protein